MSSYRTRAQDQGLSGMSTAKDWRRKAVVMVAGVLAVVMTADPFGMSAGTAFADDLETRGESFDQVIAALGLPGAAEAVPLTGNWGSLAGTGSVAPGSAVTPTEDEEVVVLSEDPAADEPETIPASLGALDSEDPPSPPAPVSLELGGIDVTVAPVDPVSTPAAVLLRVAGEQETSEAGITGVLLDVTDASSTPSAEPAVELTVSYSTFAGLVPGDWASRLRFVWVPNCAPSDPCVPTPIATVNDPATQTVTARVTVAAAESTEPAMHSTRFSPESLALSGNGGAGSFAITAGASGAAGDWGATSLAPSSTWGTSGSTGAFTWSQPVLVPATPAGPAPELALSYSSASSDGRTPSTNNQAGPIGEGFGITEGYVERAYEACSDDEAGSANNVNRVGGDLCWGAENATMVFNGSAVELIRDATSGEWHAKNDDGSLVERVTGSSWNGGEANEYWKVTTTDGTQYYFGRGKVSSGGAALNSAWTVPVYGNHPGERCYQAGFENSRCTQVWRWNLEYVVDTSGNSMTYFYDVETNRYVYDVAANPGGSTVSYVAGGHLDRIEYGTRAGSENVGSAPVRVVFDYTPRCITDLGDADSFCSPAQSATSANHWLDTPVDLICTSATSGECDNFTPVFFNLTRLSKISTSTFDGSTYRPVDAWTLNQTFDPEGTGVGLEYSQNVTLVLRSISHTGHGGTTTTADDITPPPFVFAYDFLANRADSPVAGPPLLRPRVIAIRTDSGAQVSVTYITECGPGDLPATSEPAQAANTRLCFPVKWYPNAGGNPVVEYFHKYVVDTIVESGAAPVAAGSTELITGSLDTVTRFAYGGGAAWAKPTGAMVTASEVTYSDFRGFKSVTTTIGLGDESSSARAVYFQGMGGSVTAGPAGHTVTAEDHDGRQGQVFASTTLNGASVVSEVVTVPAEPIVVAQNAAGLKATRLPSTTTYSFRFDAAGALIDRSREVTSYDANSQVSTVDDRGDLGTSADDTCTTKTYAHESDSGLAARNLVTLVSEVMVVAAACDATPTLPNDLISNILTTYDADGRMLISERLDPVDGVGHVRVSEVLDYDERGRPLSTSDALGNVSTLTYQESAGGLSQSVTTMTPDPDGWGPLPAFASTTHLDPLTGRVTSTIDPNGRVTSRTYDALGRLLTVHLPQHQGQSTPSVAHEYGVDANGLNYVLSKSLGADGATQHVGVVFYDGLLRPFQSQSEGVDAGDKHDASSTQRGRMVSHTYYDSAGRVASQTGQWWAAGAPSAVPVVPVAVPPSLTTYEYDAAGRLVSEIFWVGTDSNPANERWRTVTAFDGDTTVVIPPHGGTPEASITDLHGRVVEVVQYVRDPDEDADADTLAEILALPHQSTTYEFNHSGQLAEMRDVENNAWNYDYDWGGRQVAASDPDSGTTTTTYDLLDRVETRTNANTETVAYTYDALGRVTTLRDDSTNGNIRAQWAYDQSRDANGQILLGLQTSATRFVDGNAYASATPTYDEAYRPLTTTVTLPNIAEFSALDSRTFATEYTYAADGQVAGVSLPAVVSDAGTTVLGSETVTTRYDTASMPWWMSGGFGWGAYVAESRFAADGRAIAADLGNTYGAVVSFRYEGGTNRLAGIALKRQGYAADVDLAYGYDAAGNVTSLRDQASAPASLQDNQCFGYDGLRRLEVAWTAGSGDCDIEQSAIASADVGGAQPYWTEYGYDALGNRVSLVEHGVGGSPSTVTTTYQHGTGDASPHQVTSVMSSVGGSPVSDLAFDYDDAGNRIESTSGSTSKAYAWDVEGELVADEDYEYVYDASGIRIVRAGADGSTVYLPGGQEITIQGTAVSATRYYSFGGRTVAVRSGKGLGAVTSLVSDRDGSVVAAVPNTVWTPTSVERVYADPFGGIRGGSDADVPGDRRFLGATLDADSGLTLLGTRYYDSALGRFISVDPLLDLGDPGHFNAYAYAYNNPMTFSDPSGQKAKGSGKGGTPAQPPPSTSWAALAACSDFGCQQSWHWSSSVQGVGNFAGLIQETVWSTIVPPGLEKFVGGVGQMITDWDAFWALQEEEQRAQQAFWSGPDPWGEAWNTFWAPIAEDWVNNPGHALGGAAALGVTAAAPGGVAIKGASTAGKLANAASTAARACSFTGATVVLMANGQLKPIATIVVGDLVVASDPETGEQAAKPVEQVFVHEDVVFDLVIGGEVISTTEDHPFWSVTDQRFERADELEPGELVLSAAGATTQVTGVVSGAGRPAVAFNLAIDDIHTFHVGVSRALVHNTCGLPGALPMGPAPERVWNVLDRVDDKGAALQGYSGGSVFQNRDGLLPGGVSYREWDVNPNVPGVNRGPERLVTGSDGAAYFTTDHYESFIVVRGPTG